MQPSYFTKGNGEKLAYFHTPAKDDGAHFPTVVFLGGFKSDMSGSKATYLEEQCRTRGQAYVRFDYRGHGLSDGDFTEGTIEAWKHDALDILDHIVTGDAILVGSSMGGWISLLLLKERAERIKGFVGIAAAPDFTKEIEASLTVEQLSVMQEEGLVRIPNEYSDDPYIFTHDLITNGEDMCVLDEPCQIHVPMVLLQGKCDTSVPWEKALKISEVYQGPSNKVIFIDDGDHRLSRPQDLEKIDASILSLS